MGRFVWREIMSTDIARSLTFFTELFAWTVSEMDMGPMGTYYMVTAPGAKNAHGGMMQIDATTMPGVPGHILGNVSVTSVDDAVARASRMGGKVLTPGTDLPDNMGRFAVLQDPQGGTFGLHQGGGDSEWTPPKVGEYCWEQLDTNDLEGAKIFYGEVVGWKSSNDENPVFSLGPDMKDMFANAVKSQPGMPTQWLSLIVVASLADVRERATALGAKVLVPEIVVANMGVFAILQDPTGVTFCTWESRTA
ncbi:MAG: VOC family protein [Deltaproteobacteria bacterium]|nr:VOC family protein [Deltaproteobacteria bacterium]